MTSDNQGNTPSGNMRPRRSVIAVDDFDPRQMQFEQDPGSSDTVQVPVNKMPMSSGSSLDDIPPPQYNTSPKKDDSGKQTYPIRIDLPSGCKLYSFKEVFCRTMQISDLINVHRGTMSDDVRVIIDAMDALIDVDIRDLSIPDFKFFQLWQRVNSYPTANLHYEWTSKYGNKNSYALGRSELKITTLDISPEDLKKYTDMGLVTPTVKDYEMLHTFEWEEVYGKEDMELMQWVSSYAQFLEGDTLEEKITRFRKHKDPEIIVRVKEFSALLNYGVEEIVTLTDTNYDPEVWIESLESRIDNIQKIMTVSPKDWSANYTSYVSILAELTSELNKAKEGSGPEPERIFLPVETDFLFASL